MTNKPTRKIDKPPADKPATIAGKIAALLRSRPEIVVVIASAAGIKGDDILALAQIDMPGWVLGVVVLVLAAGYALRAHIAKFNETLAALHELDAGMKARDESCALFRAETLATFADGETAMTDHGRRIGRLESIHKAEIAAYDELRRRDTGAVKP